MPESQVALDELVQFIEIDIAEELRCKVTNWKSTYRMSRPSVFDSFLRRRYSLIRVQNANALRS